MNNNEDFNFDDVFLPDAGMNEKSAGANSKTREGRVLTVTSSKSLGTFIVRPFVTLKESDQTPIIVRKVINGYEGSCIGLKYQVPDISSFKEFGLTLSKEDFDLFIEVRNMLFQLTEPLSYKNIKSHEWLNEYVTLSNPYQIVFMHAKLVRYLGESPNITSDQIGKVRLLKFTKGEVGKSDFLTVFNKVTNSKSNVLGSKAWMSDVFSRKVGPSNKGLSIDVSRAQSSAIKTYSISVSYEDVPCEITEADLKAASDIYTKVYKVSQFDREFYTKLHQNLTKTLTACMSNNVVLRELKKKD